MYVVDYFLDSRRFQNNQIPDTNILLNGSLDRLRGSCFGSFWLRDLSFKVSQMLTRLKSWRKDSTWYRKLWRVTPSTCWTLLKTIIMIPLHGKSKYLMQIHAPCG
ncbi:hypothetical protein EV356DRAFT_247524 [Viridothelium virens]|uniref:Uncharacterized protein n=1 Tax=Viridothelium virens TaxID=1048519 RepID=A0A6A6H3Z5_VIRVR|nr:hypothetical protein EV356DRAFT_247524 [Viridothelium virens]